MKMRHHSKLTVSRRLELYKSMGASRHKRRVRPGFHHDKAIVASVFQLLCGIGALVLGTVSVLTHSLGHYFGSGFWGGTFFTIAGVTGIIAGVKKNNTPITIFTVFSVIAFMLAVVMLALAALGISPTHTLYQDTPGHMSVIILSVYVATAIVEILASLVSIALCFKAVCMAPHSDRQYEIAVQSPVSSEYGPQLPQGRSNSYGQYELCSDMDTEFTVSEGLTPLAPSSQLTTSCTEELPILSSVLENNITPDDATCLLHHTSDPATMLDSPAISTISAQQENEVNDLLEKSPDIAPPGTPPPSYHQILKHASRVKPASSTARNKGVTAGSKTKNQSTTQKKTIPPLAKPPSGPTRSGMRKSASQSSNRSMTSSSSQQGLVSRQSSSSLRERSDSSSSAQTPSSSSPGKHKRPSHLDIPPKGTSSRTRGQVRQRSSRSSIASTQSTTSQQSMSRGRGIPSQRGSHTPSSSKSQSSSSLQGSRANSDKKSTTASSTTSQKAATTGTGQKASSQKTSRNLPGSQSTKGDTAARGARTATQARPRPAAGRARPTSWTDGNPPQRSPLDTLL